MKPRLFRLFSLALVLALLTLSSRQTSAEVGVQATSLYLPLIQRGCTATGTAYEPGPAQQYDIDNPVRPAWNHADKNLALRSYTSVNKTKGLVRVPPDPHETKQPPQFATFFSSYRVPTFSNVYAVYGWDWGSGPPYPGARTTPISSPEVTAVGFQTTPGELLRVPISDYDIGGIPVTYHALVLFADADSITLRYTRDDSSAPPGYTVYIDKICTDSNLLALYNQLDSASGPRYVYMGGRNADPLYWYNLPNLTEGQVFGTASSTEMIVAIQDTGSFLDPRACTSGGRHWWEVGGAVCPP